MKRYLFIFLASFQLVACSGQGNSSSVKLNKEDVSKKTDDIVKEYIDLGIFSGVVLISEQGEPFYKKAFGLANRETNTPNTLETKFVIGSMNKDFTRVIILQLVDEGKLHFDSKMDDFLDGFEQKQANNITIDHLLNHSSGFGDYHNPDYFKLPYDKKNIQGILPVIKGMDLMFPPGAENEYSNAGYIILGAIIEKVTGKSYALNVEERIAKPLKLESIVTYNVKEIPNRAIGYIKTFNGYEDNNEFISEPRSDGGFYSNVFDIHKFYKTYLHTNQLFSKEVRDKDSFFKHISSVYNEKGAGIPLAGGFNGANTVHLEMLADDISIVVFANMDEPVAEKIAIGILNIINGKQPEKPLLPAKLNVYKYYKESGIEYVKENFEELTSNWFEGDPKDRILNNLGYDLFFDNKLDEALDIFKLNTELFPNIGNCWDSYGEALLKTGRNDEALQAYKKALQINPNIPSAKKAVKELEK
jgi:CubicO group peptidase (beta-lactamase class C family)